MLNDHHQIDPHIFETKNVCHFSDATKKNYATDVEFRCDRRHFLAIALCHWIPRLFVGRISGFILWWIFFFTKKWALGLEFAICLKQLKWYYHYYAPAIRAIKRIDAIQKNKIICLRSIANNLHAHLRDKVIKTAIASV